MLFHISAKVVARRVPPMKMRVMMERLLGAAFGFDTAAFSAPLARLSDQKKNRKGKAINQKKLGSCLLYG